MRAAPLVLVLLLSGCLAPAALEPTSTPEREVFSRTHVFLGEYDTSGYGSRTLERGPYSSFTWRVERATSPVDGADIAIGVLLPEGVPGERFPVVAIASPYFPPLDLVDGVSSGDLGAHGYVLALVAVRGTAGSGGCMDFMGPNERADVDAAVTWLGTQPWSSGAVGMLGGSYDGGTQWGAAGFGNPHLRTIVPLSGVTDPFDLYFRNGTSVNRGLWHSADYMGPSALQNNNPATGRPLDDTIHAVCPEILEGLRASLHGFETGERDPAGFWAERDLRAAVVANYTGSVFLIHGLQDWNVVPGHVYPWVHELEAKGVPVKHLLGQWMHMAPDQQTGPTNPPYVVGPRLVDWMGGNPHLRWDFMEILLRWLDRWLKCDGADAPACGVDVGPRVQVEDSSGRWRSDDAWPARGAAPRSFWLAPGGALADRPAEGRESVPVAADPGTLLAFASVGERRLLTTCAACAEFASAPLAEELRFAGAPRVHVTVTPKGPGGVLSAYLFADDGSASRRLGWGSIDLRFAEGDGASRPVAPDRPVVARMQLEPLDAVVPAGARLVLVLAPGTYGDHATSVDQPSSVPWPLLVEAGGERSVLLVDAFAVDPDLFFEPPGVRARATR